MNFLQGTILTLCIVINTANYFEPPPPPFRSVVVSPWRRGPVLDDPDSHVGEHMLPTGQSGGETKNNPQRVGKTCKSRKITHPRDDNSEIKQGPPGWGFSIGLVTQSCKKVIPRILRRRETGQKKYQCTLQESICSTCLMFLYAAI
jgi:hypothetical protein